VSGREHVCLVFESLGATLLEYCEANRNRPMPLYAVQAFADQLVRAVAFLHECRLVHTDLKLENVLLASRAPFVPLPPGRLNKHRVAVEGGLVGPPTTEVRLIDFGSAVYDWDYKGRIICTRQYRAPEVILGLGWSFPADVWSLGCILMELYDGQLLFRTHSNDEHVKLMETVVGRFPGSVVRRFERQRMEQRRRRRQHRGDEGRSRTADDRDRRRDDRSRSRSRSRNTSSSDDSDGPDSTGDFFRSDGTVRLPRRGETAAIREARPLARIVHPRDTVFLDLIRSMLELDAARRIPLRDALNHKFFRAVRGSVQLLRPVQLLRAGMSMDPFRYFASPDTFLERPKSETVSVSVDNRRSGGPSRGGGYREDSRNSLRDGDARRISDRKRRNTDIESETSAFESSDESSSRSRSNSFSGSSEYSSSSGSRGSREERGNPRPQGRVSTGVAATPAPLPAARALSMNGVPGSGQTDRGGRPSLGGSHTPTTTLQGMTTGTMRRDSFQTAAYVPTPAAPASTRKQQGRPQPQQARRGSLTSAPGSVAISSGTPGAGSRATTPVTSSGRVSG
jgi:serine/threonine protein kinase